MRAAFLICICAFAQLAIDAQVVAITGGTIVDGTGAAARRADVLVRDGRIAAVGAGIAIPVGAVRVDATGHTLTPGFFDLHTHLPYSAVNGLSGDWGKNLKAYLYFGVTSVAEFGTYPETFEPMRRLIRDGVIAGPRIHYAARITTPGGHGAEGGRGDFFSLEVTTPAEARAAVRRLLPYHPDAIKVFTDGWRYGFGPDMTSMDEATLAAIVKAAHANSIEVITHTVTLERAKIAARAGVDVIGHGIGNARVDADLIGLMKANGTAYASTLAVYETKGDAVSPMMLKILEPAALAIVTQRRETATRPSRARVERWHRLTENIAALKNGGATLVAGTDAGVTGTLHGWSSLREMALLVSAGLTPLEALTAATGASAKAIHVDNERGTIVPGKLADLVMIEGSPHENIADVMRVKRVWLGGKEVDRVQLERSVASPDVTPIPARKAVPLIDDMEGARTCLGTLRVNATDSGNDNSKMLFQRTLRSRGNHALSVQARMGEKERPFAEVQFPLSPGGMEPVDASAFAGVELEARGDGEYRVVFQQRSRRSGKPVEARFEAGPAWSLVRVAFPGGERFADLQIVGVQLSRPAGEQGWIELDNLRFYSK